MPLGRSLSFLASLFALSVAGCAGTVPPPAGADAVRIDKAPPAPGSRPLRGLRATDGQGCGLFTHVGTYEGASANLREQAKALGADYVQITDVKEPYADHGCVHKEFTLVGVAYRSPTAPNPAAPQPASSGTPVALPSTACTSARTIEFSARTPGTAAFGAWFDQMPNATPSGLELRYDPSRHELALLRYPEAKTVAVADDPVELGTDWHTFRLERSADKVAVWLDGKLILLHAAADPAAGSSFALDAAGIELRGMQLGCADATQR
jgi:hypothetical protein